MTTKPVSENKLGYWKALSSEPVHFCDRIRLENNVTILYDDRRGLAEGSDGRIYYAVCQEVPGQDEGVRLLGWNAEISGEVVLK